METNKTHQLNLPVQGMSCASCAITIQKTLQKTDGVISCEVNYGNEKAKIEIDPSKTSITELNKKIEPLGYSLHNPDNHNNHSTHTMPDGSVMKNSHMDHSEHLGLGQSKEDKLKELERQREKVYFVLPITLMAFILMMWEIMSQSFNWFPKFFIPHDMFQTISLILSTIVLFWIGNEFLKEVVTFIKYKVANMYTLVGIGTLTAYLYSAIIILFPITKTLLNLPDMVYFDVTIVVIGFIYLGKFLETRSKLLTGEAIEKLLNLQAKTAIVERNGQEVEVSIEDVLIDDILIVKPASKIPVDGVILEGKSTLDESMITGESLPIDKKPGDLVIGGTINKHGTFKFKASKVGSDTMLSQIIKMVDEAQGSKAPIQALADKISEFFVPAVLIISLITLVSWIIIGLIFIPFDEALSLGILSFTGILVIACPCALGLATPTAIIVGTGKGATNGILIKDAESLEKLYKVDTIVTDKTGTITKGKPEVTDIIILDGTSESEIIKTIASLEKRSEHPIAEAIINKANEMSLELESVSDFEIIEGKGLKGTIDNVQYFAGNKTLIEELNISYNQTELDILTEAGKTPIFLIKGSELISIIGVSDSLKNDVINTVKSLHRLGLKIVMLTGDNQKTAQYIANLAGIDEVIAEVLPQDKANKIKELQNSGRIVAMVGDGINDAPALASANVGIAMATGTDVAIESASITLLNGDFSKILKAIKLSKFTMNAIKQNLFWAFAYNILGIPLAAGIFYPLGLTLNPVFAGLAMAFSSVSVVANSLRLKTVKI